MTLTIRDSYDENVNVLVYPYSVDYCYLYTDGFRYFIGMRVGLDLTIVL